MKLYEHKYMDFVLEDGRIDFIWKAATSAGQIQFYSFSYNHHY